MKIFDISIVTRLIMLQERTPQNTEIFGKNDKAFSRKILKDTYIER